MEDCRGESGNRRAGDREKGPRDVCTGLHARSVENDAPDGGFVPHSGQPEAGGGEGGAGYGRAEARCWLGTRLRQGTRGRSPREYAEWSVGGIEPCEKGEPGDQWTMLLPVLSESRDVGEVCMATAWGEDSAINDASE